MSKTQPARPAAFYVLMAGLLFQGLSALGGGSALILDPSGRLLQVPRGLLEGSPFDDYLMPGLILFFVLGLFPLVVLYGLWQRFRWACPAALAVGAALLVWIGVEILMVGYHSRPPLQLIYGLLGLLLLALPLLPSVRRDCAASPRHLQV